MRTHAMFVTPADFKNYYGLDLEAELKEDGAELDSNRAASFLMRVEDRLLSWIDANTWRNRRWECISPNQKEHLQKAIIIQAMYVFRNSDISLDSGYDPQRGKIIDKIDLQRIEICDAALDQLKTCGLYNHVMKNHYRWPRVVG